ncbi:MAG: hypothetical protein ACO3A4_10910 [Silvanigrellaceae bacterium]
MNDAVVSIQSGSSSISERGQVLPLLALLMALFAALGISLASFLFSSSKNLSRDEAEFQELYKRKMTTASVLNSIAENNLRVAKILSLVGDVYLSAAGRSLDIAASSPLWEKDLPRTLLEKNFSVFLSAAPLAGQALGKLVAANKIAIRRLPPEMLSKLDPLTFTETVCLLFVNQGQIRPGGLFSRKGDGCKFAARQTFLSAPPFRQMTDLRPLTVHFDPADGMTLIRIDEDFVLNDGLLPLGTTTAVVKRESMESPFGGKKFVLTHAAFCKKSAKKESQGLCPGFSLPDIWTRNGLSPQSAFPNWTISVEDLEDEI